jgi:hypothetical protein
MDVRGTRTSKPHPTHADGEAPTDGGPDDAPETTHAPTHRVCVNRRSSLLG